MIRCRRADRVAVVSQGGRTYVASPRGEVVVLRDNAVLVWESLTSPDGGYCDVDDVVDRVAARAGLPVTEVAGETHAFLDSLCESGLLTAE